MKFNKSFSFVILGMALATLASCSGSGRKFYKLIEEVPATCTRGGMLAHYESQPDGDKETIYLDVDKKQVELEDLIIPALGHDMTYVPEQYATCDKEGVIAHYHCANCDLDYEDEAGQILADDLHTSTKGHVMDQEWTPSDNGETHYHKCAREGCTHIEDEEACVYDQEVVKEEYAVEGQENTYYKSCVCGRKGTETFTYTHEVFDANDDGWEENYRADVGLDKYDPSTDTTVSLNDIGIPNDDYVTIPTGTSHFFGSYNLVEHLGIDLKFNVKYTAAAGSYISIYFGNERNEEGLQLRFMTHGEPSNAYLQGYYITSGGGLVRDDGTTPFYTETNGESYFLTKPGIKENNEHEVHIKITPLPEAQQTVTNYIMFSFFIEVDNYAFRKDESQQPLSGVTVGFPETYFFNQDFSGYAHSWIRFSNTTASTAAAIKDAKTESRLIVMNDLDCIGSKLFSEPDSTFTLKDLKKDGHKFVGWYTTNGVQFTKNTLINTKMVVYPYFVEVGDAMSHTAVTLSDLGLLEQGSKPYTTNNEIAGDFEEGFRRIPVGGKTTSVSISFVAQFEFAKARGGKVVDDYFQFGLPYDYKDNQTRFIFRINANSGASTLRGYVGGPATSLGEHGTEGTYFNDEDFTITEGASYLITMSYQENSNGAGLEYTFEIVDLGSHYTASFSYAGIEFINSDDFSFSNPYRNYFSVIRSRADAVLTMKNAW